MPLARVLHPAHLVIKEPPDLSALDVVARAITPPMAGRRFDTWFLMAEASRLQLIDLAEAHRQWTSIEHDLTDLAPWVPLVNRSWVNLVSERSGNFQIHPQWGPLIDQMWVH